MTVGPRGRVEDGWKRAVRGGVHGEWEVEKIKRQETETSRFK